jgi:hypothetical protein
MPSRYNSKTTIDLAKKLADNIGCNYVVTPIEESIELTKNQISEQSVKLGELNTKEIELQKTATHIQWRYVGEAWTDLVLLSDLKGEKGDQGDKGDEGPSIVSGEFVADDLVFTKDDATTVTITDAKIDLKGEQGETGPAGSDASVTKVNVEAVLTGEISSHTHAGAGGLSQSQVEGLI